MSVENNERIVNTNEEIVEVPKAMESFLAGMPKTGNVPNREEKPNQEKTSQELADELAGEDKTPKGEEAPKEGEEGYVAPVVAPIVPAVPAEGNGGDDGEEALDSVIGLIASTYKDLDLEGEFEDDEEGLTSVVGQIVEKSKTIAATKALEDFFESKPLVKLVSDHLDQGGSLVSLIQTQQVEDFSKIELKEDDVTALAQMYSNALSAKGVDEDEIEAIVNSAKNEGVLFARAKKSQEFLTDKQKEIVNAQIKAEKDEHTAELNRQIKVKEDIAKLAVSGKINGVPISADQGKRLIDFTSKQNSQGKTERDVKYEALTLEQWLFLDSLVMDDFKTMPGEKDRTPTKTPLKLKIKKAKPTVDLNTGGGATAKLAQAGIKDPRDLFKI